MKGITFSFATLAVAALLGAACTVHQTEAAAVSGPSETALSVTITASPDSISQDGRSTSTIGPWPQKPMHPTLTTCARSPRPAAATASSSRRLISAG